MADLTTQTIDSITYVDSRVEVDGKTFVSCNFSNVTFAYAGGTAPSFVGCTFDGVVLQFIDKAANTLEFLTKMHGRGLASSVQDISRSIRSAGKVMGV